MNPRTLDALLKSTGWGQIRAWDDDRVIYPVQPDAVDLDTMRGLLTLSGAENVGPSRRWWDGQIQHGLHFTYYPS